MNADKLFALVVFMAGIVLSACADDPQWTGGAGDGQLGNYANWSTGVVPTGGNVVIDGITSATTLSNSAGSTFAPTAITFGDGNTAVVTIGGDKTIKGLVAVTNLSSGIHHIFNCEVSFADGIAADILAASGDDNYVKYPGGMTAYTFAKAENNKISNVSGQITITKDIGNWARYVNIDLIALKDSGTRLLIPHSVTTSNPNFSLDSGTTLTIDGDLTSSKGAFTYLNNGMVEVSGWVVKNSAGDTAFAEKASSGFIKTYGLTEKSATTKDVVLTSTADVRYRPNWIIGAGGIPKGTTTMSHDATSGGGELIMCVYAAEDFAIDGHLGLGYGKSTGSRWPILHLYTNDYGGTEGHTVTFGGTVGGNTQHSCLRIYGCGTFHATSKISLPRGVEVYDTATIALDPGVTIGKRLILAKNAQIVVTRSGVVDLSETITIGTTISSGTTLGFNFTESEEAPVLKLKNSSTTTISGTVKVNVSAADGVRPTARFAHQLTQGADFAGKNVVLADGAPEWVRRVNVDAGGNIVLSVGQGMVIVVR